jgi:CRP-like cAMP-binding protein
MVQPRNKEQRSSLKGIAIFSAITPDAIERVERRCAWKRYVPGELVLDYLDASDDVFFLTLGEVRVTIHSSAGKPVSFRELSAGEVFGEFPAIDGGPRSASVEARTNCLIASIPGSSFRELLRTEPGLAYALLPRMVKMIRALTTRVYEFSTLAVNNRIQAELLRLASSGPPDSNTARIVPAPTHAEIASRLSTHREAVTRELNRLSRIGIIERRGGTLLVKDFDRLAEMVRRATDE